MHRQGLNGQWTNAPLPVGLHEPALLRGALNELIHGLAHDGELISSGRSARKTLAVMLAMLQSHARGNVRVDLG